MYPTTRTGACVVHQTWTILQHNGPGCLGFGANTPGSPTGRHLAVDETVILLHPPLPLAGVSIVMERERQQNDGLVNG